MKRVKNKAFSLLTLLKGEISQTDLLNYYNASIIYDKIPKSVRGFVFEYDNVNFIIINKNLSNYLKKKTIIHELAHIELNQLNQRKTELFEFYINEYEDEAEMYVKNIYKVINND